MRAGTPQKTSYDTKRIDIDKVQRYNANVNAAVYYFVNLEKKADAANAQVEAKNLITEMLANILTENEGENKADLLVFSHKGNDVYLHGYDASEGRMLTYNGELASFTSGEFKAHVETLLGTLTTDGALKEVAIADANDWRNPAKTAEIVSGLDAKNDMIVYANYEILASFTEGAGTKVENSADLSSEVAKGGKVVLAKDIMADGKLTVSKK